MSFLVSRSEVDQKILLSTLWTCAGCSSCFLFFARGICLKVRLLSRAGPSLAFSAAASPAAFSGLSSEVFFRFAAALDWIPLRTLALSIFRTNSLFSRVVLAISARILLVRSAFSAVICSVRWCLWRRSALLTSRQVV